MSIAIQSLRTEALLATMATREVKRVMRRLGKQQSRLSKKGMTNQTEKIEGQLFLNKLQRADLESQKALLRHRARAIHLFRGFQGGRPYQEIEANLKATTKPVLATLVDFYPGQRLTFKELKKLEAWLTAEYAPTQARQQKMEKAEAKNLAYLEARKARRAAAEKEYAALK